MLWEDRYRYKNTGNEAEFNSSSFDATPAVVDQSNWNEFLVIRYNAIFDTDEW